MRGLAAGLLAVLGLLVVPLGNLGIWTSRQLLDTESFTTLANNVLHQSAVKDALADRLTEQVEQRIPVPFDTGFVVEPAVRSVTGTDQFEQIFDEAVRSMHEQLERGDDRLELDFDAVLPLVRDAVAQIDEGIADRIPESGLPAITVVKKQDLPELWAGVDIARRASWALPVIAVVLLALAVAIAPRRDLTLLLIGLGITLESVLVVTALRLGRAPLSRVVGSQVDKDSFNAAWDTITDSLVVQTLVLAIIGVAVAVVGMYLLVRARRGVRPAEWA